MNSIHSNPVLLGIPYKLDQIVLNFVLFFSLVMMLDNTKCRENFAGEKKCLNSELWHACAGPLVSLPPVGSRVVYFPQGHSEQVIIGILLCLYDGK